MKIRLIASMSGTRNGLDWPRPGETMELPDDEGAQLVASKLARQVQKHEAAVETATAPTQKEERRPRRGMTKKDLA